MHKAITNTGRTHGAIDAELSGEELLYIARRCCSLDKVDLQLDALSVDGADYLRAIAAREPAEVAQALPDCAQTKHALCVLTTSALFASSTRKFCGESKDPLTSSTPAALSSPTAVFLPGSPRLFSLTRAVTRWPLEAASFAM